MKEIDFQVKTISSEMIKPSSPTPSHLKNFKLSVLDQNIPPLPIPTLLLYTAPDQKETQLIHPDIIPTVLKSSLSETLCRFYPLAGRFSESEIDCNDEGIPFIVTQVNCPISIIPVNSTPNKFELQLSKLYPPQELLLGTGVNLAIKVNVFSCGGFGISWYHMHKILDATSNATFLRYWTTMAKQHHMGSQLNVAAALPDFDATVAAFPPCPKAEQFKVGAMPKPNPGAQDNQPRIVVKTFIFRDEAIMELKSKGASEQVPKPSRFEAVSGFIWEQLLQLIPQEGDTVLVFSVDLRARSDPPLPKGSMGNLISTVSAKANKRDLMPLLITRIHGAVLSIKDQIREYQGEERAEALRSHWHKQFQTAFANLDFGYKEGTYKLISWCKLGFIDNVDFGFGKPKVMVPTDGNICPGEVNKIFLTDSQDGSGIEAWVFLEEKHMRILESNHHFLAFTFPKY